MICIMICIMMMIINICIMGHKYLYHDTNIYDHHHDNYYHDSQLITKNQII